MAVGVVTSTTATLTATSRPPPVPQALTCTWRDLAVSQTLLLRYEARRRRGLLAKCRGALSRAAHPLAKRRVRELERDLRVLSRVASSRRRKRQGR